MIVVRVELHSAITGDVQELARAIIANDGSGTAQVGNYTAYTYRGRDARAFAKQQVQRSARVLNWPRQRLHVWNLVAAALSGMGYGRTAPPQERGETDPADAGVRVV